MTYLTNAHIEDINPNQKQADTSRLNSFGCRESFREIGMPGPCSWTGNVPAVKRSSQRRLVPDERRQPRVLPRHAGVRRRGTEDEALSLLKKRRQARPLIIKIKIRGFGQVIDLKGKTDQKCFLGC